MDDIRRRRYIRNMRNFKFDTTPVTRKWGWATLVSACIMLLLLFFLCFFSPDNMAIRTKLWLTYISGFFSLIWIICAAMLIYRISADHLNAKINNKKFEMHKRLIVILVLMSAINSMSAKENNVSSTAISSDSIQLNSKTPDDLISRNFFVEFWGPSLGIGIGYDQRFEPNSIFGFSAGLAYTNGNADNAGSWGSSNIGTYRYIEFKGVTLPLELNVIMGKRASKFELGLGATPCILKRYEYKSRVYGSKGDSKETRLNIFGTMNIGYRLQRKSGFFLRAALTFLIGDIKCSPFDGLLCVPNLSLGYTIQELKNVF